ncbi:MAG: 23S rRNA (guanosine(2251)-2'-O)-methyltransferase RlmB [Kofleriaceae bacterium]
MSNRRDDRGPRGGRQRDDRGAHGGGDRGARPDASRGGDRGARPDASRSSERSGPRPGDPGERIVYGANPIRELIARKPQSVRAVWVDPQRAGRSTSDPVAGIVGACRAANIRLEDRDRATLDRVAGEGAVHQGVVAWLGPYAYAALEELVQPGDEPPLIVALDGVEDPRNLGAILRSAYLLGARGVIIPDHRAAAVTSVTAKASAGASELLPVAMVGNLVRALDELKDHGLWRVAVHATEGAQRIDQIDATLGLVVVLGAEGTGVRPLVAKNCDFHAVIPMARDAVGSFNVSVAAAIALYELRRGRMTRGA